MDGIEKAKELFMNGYNCAQSVVGAYCEMLGMDFDTAMRAAEGFGGGMGRMRLTCGAVSGMALLAGLKYSKAEASDTETRTVIYETVRKMSEEFKVKNSSLICADLLGLAEKEKSAKPEERTKQYYSKRPCAGCVADCAEIVEKYLL